jgi:hypothetical protein
LPEVHLPLASNLAVLGYAGSFLQSGSCFAIMACAEPCGSDFQLVGRGHSWFGVATNHLYRHDTSQAAETCTRIQDGLSFA